MSGFIKLFDNGGENMSLMIKDNSVLFKYSEQNIGTKLKKLKA